MHVQGNDVSARRAYQDGGVEDLSASDDLEQAHRVIKGAGHDEVGEVMSGGIVVVDRQQSAGRRIRLTEPAVARYDDPWQPRVVPPIARE